MESSTEIADDFASAMQQLSAEAQRDLSSPRGGSLNLAHLIAQITFEFRGLNQRLQSLETKLAQRLDETLPGANPAEPFNLPQRFQQLENQVAGIHAKEGMNQRLFDSLHDELIKYRDNFLHESLQKPFIRDLIHLFDDLNVVASQLKVGKSDAKRNAIGQTRENLENSIHTLVEILHRLEVNEIEPRDEVDLSIHKVMSFEPTEIPEENGKIVMRLKRGFFWRDKLLRPEEVIAKRFS